jgi:hypothetical protein
MGEKSESMSKQLIKLILIWFLFASCQESENQNKLLMVIKDMNSIFTPYFTYNYTNDDGSKSISLICKGCNTKGGNPNRYLFDFYKRMSKNDVTYDKYTLYNTRNVKLCGSDLRVMIEIDRRKSETDIFLNKFRYLDSATLLNYTSDSLDYENILFAQKYFSKIDSAVQFINFDIQSSEDGEFMRLYYLCNKKNIFIIMLKTNVDKKLFGIGGYII